MCVGVGSHDLEGGFNSPSRGIVHAINLVLCIVKDSRVRQCNEGSSDGDADVESPQLHCFYIMSPWCTGHHGDIYNRTSDVKGRQAEWHPLIQLMTHHVDAVLLAN